MACVKKTDTKEINFPLLSLIIKMGFLFYFIFYCLKNLPENAMVIQIWEIAIHCPCDLSEHRYCPCVTGRLEGTAFCSIRTKPLAWLLLK